MKKFLSFLLCLLLFSGCSKPAAEESSTPMAEATTTPTIETTSTPSPSPTPYSGNKIYYPEQHILGFDFQAKSNAVIKAPEDFATQEEFYEFIYQDCERRHQELVSLVKGDQITELFLRVVLMDEWLPQEFASLQPIVVPCILTNKDLLNEWKEFVLNTSLKKNPSYQYKPEIAPTGMGYEIIYCAITDSSFLSPPINYLFKDSFRYYYPDPATEFISVTFADWDEETQKQYEEFENKIYQLAADKFKAAYEQAANYPFLN